MGNCMVKQKPYPKSDKPITKMTQADRNIRYLDYFQSENDTSLAQRIEKRVAPKVWRSNNSQLNIDQSPSKMSQKSILQTIETEASYLAKQTSFKDTERTISSYNRDFMETTRSDAMTPMEILQSLRQKKIEK